MIDVIIPSLNSGRFLAECLESIRLQGVEKNVVLVDGGSTDNTFEVLAQFPEVRVYREKGLVKDAFTYGFGHTSGDYVICFAGDNVMLSGFLELAQKSLDADPEIGLVFGQAIGVNDQGIQTGIIHAGGYDPARLRQGNYIDFCEGIIRRKAWEYTFPTWLIFHLDWYVWLKISMKWKVAELRTPVILYRVHGGSLSSTKRGEINAEYVLMKQILASGEF